MTFTKLIEGMSAETYHSDPCEAPSLSSSMACLLVNECPAIAHLRHPKLGGRQGTSTESTERGDMIHEMLLGTGKGMAVVDAKDWRTNAAKAARDEARKKGLVPVLAHKERELKVAAKGIADRMREMGIHLDGKSETVAFWTETADDGTEVQCRAMMDQIWVAAYRALDLKTCANAHPKQVKKSILDYGYDIQHAAYTSAIRALWPEGAGRERLLFLFAECDEPYLVTPVELDGEYREIGDRKWRRAINLWARCLKEDKWPGYVTGWVQVSPPPWAIEGE